MFVLEPRVISNFIVVAIGRNSIIESPEQRKIEEMMMLNKCVYYVESSTIGGRQTKKKKATILALGHDTMIY
jgi:hypothetical protein